MEPVVRDAKEFATSVYTTSLDALQMALMLTTALAWNSCIKELVAKSGYSENKGWALLVYAIVMTVILVAVIMFSKRFLGYKGQLRPIVYSVIPQAM
jgi:hypothetical protein